MAAANVSAFVNKPSFIPGEAVELTLEFEGAAEELQHVSNLSVDFFRVDPERNQFSFGFGAAPHITGNTLTISKNLPEKFKTGLYVLDYVKLTQGTNPEPSAQTNVRFTPVFFTVRNAAEVPQSEEQVIALRDKMEKLRSAYVNHVIQTKWAEENNSETRKFRVLVFGVGCLLRAHQQLQGYYITPLGLGLSHRRLHEIVNTVLDREGIGSLEFREEIEQQYEGSTPTFLVSYTQVLAKDETDALDHCRTHANTLFQILGLDRGHKPREFACTAFEYETRDRWHMYQMQRYPGNLISDFNPFSTANRIERIIPRLQNDPFARLLINTYSDATAETDYGFSLLRYWSVLELVADRSFYGKAQSELMHPNGKPVVNSDGKPETTKTKSGRVYAYICDQGAFKAHGSRTVKGVTKKYMIGGDPADPKLDSNTEVFSLWEMVRAGYAIRNYVAHEGQFDPRTAAAGNEHQQLAARLVIEGHPDPLDFIKSKAELALLRELS